MTVRACDYVIENMFMIANKEAITVPFKLNDVQRMYSSSCTSNDIILKARREGFSSYLRGEFLVACMTEPNTRAVILSQDTQSTQKHLEVVKFHIKHMVGGAPSIGYNSKLEITFPRNDSTFYIGTAGSDTFGRGDTITHLHLSEAAFYPDLKALQASVLQAAAHAKRKVLESTANGFNYFQSMCEKAQRGEGIWKLHFHPWYHDLSNFIPLLEGERLHLRDEEVELQRREKLSDARMKWYANKRLEFMDSDDDNDGLKLLHQEYPSTIEEAFISSGSTFFRKIIYDRVPTEVEGKLKIFRKPVPGHKYVLGVDYCGGVGQDFGVIQVIDVTDMVQAAVYRDNWVDAEQLSIKAVQIANRYNDGLSLPYIVPEVNNHGLLGVDVLKRMYPTSRIYKREAPTNKKKNNESSKKRILGFQTSENTKSYACNTLRTYLKRNLIIHDKDTYHELQIFAEVEGKLSAPEDDHDDCVMSLALAAVGIKELVKAAVTATPEPEQPSPPGQVLYPFSNAADLLEIVQNTPKGKSLISSFYSHKEGSIILNEMARLHG